MFKPIPFSSLKPARAALILGVCAALSGVAHAQHVTRPGGKSVAPSTTVSPNAAPTTATVGTEKTAFSKVKIAVVQPKNARSENDTLVTDKLSEIFSSQPRFQLVTRDLIADVVGEISLSETGVVSADKNKALGQIKGVDYLVLGRLTNASTGAFDHTLVPQQNTTPEPPKKKKKGGLGGFLNNLITPAEVRAAQEQQRLRDEERANQPLPTERWARSEVAASCTIIEIPSGVVLRAKSIIGKGESPTEAGAFDAAMRDLKDQFQGEFVPLIEAEIPPIEGAISEVSPEPDDTYIRIKSGKNMGVAKGMMFEIVRVVAKTQMDGSVINDKKVIGYGVVNEVDEDWAKLSPIKNDASHTRDMELFSKITNLSIARELRAPATLVPAL